MKADAATSSHEMHIRFGKSPFDRGSRGSVPSVWKNHCCFPVRCRGEKPNAPKQKYKETHYRKTGQNTGQKRPPPQRRRQGWQRAGAATGLEQCESRGCQGRGQWLIALAHLAVQRA